MRNIPSWNAPGNHCWPANEQEGGHVFTKVQATLQHSQSLIDGPFFWQSSVGSVQREKVNVALPETPHSAAALLRIGAMPSRHP